MLMHFGQTLSRECTKEADERRSLKRAIRPCDINTLAAAYVTGVHRAREQVESHSRVLMFSPVEGSE